MTQNDSSLDREKEARRQFLLRCGKWAAITPPAVTLMLSVADRNYAVASSGWHGDVDGERRGRRRGDWHHKHHWHHRRWNRHRHANNGFGNGGGDGVPGRSGHNDGDR